MSYIDTRDLYEELNELNARYEAYLEGEDEADDDFTLDDSERRQELADLADAVGDEFPYGATLIPSDEFLAYAQELCEDIDSKVLGALPGYLLNAINWEDVADQLAWDYSHVMFEGQDYLFRT